MRKLVLFVLVWVMIAGAKDLMQDKSMLENEIVRLHVVGQSSTEKDQNIKLRVKDAVVAYLKENIPEDLDAESVKNYLAEHLDKVQDTAIAALEAAGSNATVNVSLQPEEFPQRDYGTFSLPAGVYESLRVTIGAGEGKNWWCVIFPSLCDGVTARQYKHIAVSAGLSESLAAATAREESCEIRFFLLDCLGRLENFFHFG